MNFELDKTSWRKVKLGDVALEYSNRINNPSESEYKKFVGSSNISQWDFRVRSWESTDSVTSAMKLFESNDYLLVRRSLYASDFRERAPRASSSGVCSGDILTIKENPEFISDGFLVGVLNSPDLWKYVVANASGSITRRIKWKDLSNYEFLLPPKVEQAKIAELLWSLDDILEKENALIEKQFILKDTLRKKYFLDKGVDQIKIGEVATLTAGGTPSTKVKEYWDEGTVPWLSSGEVHKKIVRNTEKKITVLGLENSSAKMMGIHTCLIALAGQGKTKGTVAITEIELCTNQSVASIIANKDRIEPYYLYHNLDSRYSDFRHVTGKQNSRTGLNLNILRDFQISYHNKNERLNIISELNYLDASIQSSSTRRDQTKKLQRSLINKIF